MWPGNSPELVKAKMLHNYLDECRRREIRELRNKKDHPSHLILLGKRIMSILPFTKNQH